MKKVIALLLAMVMVFSLAGCKKDTATDAGKADAGKTDAGKTDSGKAIDEAKDVTLDMWCIATETDSNRHSYEAAIEEFEKAHPNIHIKMEATENEAYKTKIKAASTANELPDIFFTWGMGFLKEFVDNGRVYCLDEALKNYSNDLPANMLENHSFDGKLYAVPTTFNIVAMFCNMNLLKEVGYDTVPATWDDLMKCCDALVAKGITPFGVAGKEPWCLSEYTEPIVEKTIGSQNLVDMYKGNKAWTSDEGVAKAIDTFIDMIKKGYFSESDVALSHNEVKENFKVDKYAFYINGTFNMADFVPLEDHITLAEFPVIDSSKAEMGMLIGGANDSLAVSASSKNAAVAADTVFELAKAICHYGYIDGNGAPAWKVDYDTSAATKLTNQLGTIIAGAKQTVLFGDNFLSADDAAKYLDKIVQAYSLAIDGKTYQELLQKDLQPGK